MRKIVLNLLSVLFILFCYQLLINLTSNSYLPTLNNISVKIYDIIVKESFIYHSLMTLKRVFIALFFSIVFSLFLGIIISLKKDINIFFEVPINISLIIPGFVWAIILLIILGVGNLSVILAISLSIIPTLMIIVSEGIKNLNLSLFDVAKVFKVPLPVQVYLILLPQLLPQIMTMIRTGFSQSWKIALVAELFGIGNGVGYKIILAYSNFDVSKIFALTACFGIITLLIDKFIFTVIEEKLYFWKKTK